MTTPIIDPSTQKAIDDIEYLKRKIMCDYSGIPKEIFLYNLPKRTKPSKWQRFKAWIKSKLK